MADSTARRPDRMRRLETIPQLKSEAETLSLMTRRYCRAFHGTPDGLLCPACAEFLAYALRRLASCPYGADKPVCAKCRIHCYRAAEKETARRIMRWSGPRLLFWRPKLVWLHLLQSRRPAPEKPRNRNRHP